MASIQIPEARVLMITPFDKSILQDVEKLLWQVISESVQPMMEMSFA